ncbi:unnamed protein product, partial [Nesidiocoris tenuis]
MKRQRFRFLKSENSTNLEFTKLTSRVWKYKKLIFTIPKFRKLIFGIPLVRNLIFSILLLRKLIFKTVSQNFSEAARKMLSSLADVSLYRESKSHACEACGRSYKYKGNLLQHQRNECGQEPKFQCPFCPFRSKQRSNLKTHIRGRHNRSPTAVPSTPAGNAITLAAGFIRIDPIGLACLMRLLPKFTSSLPIWVNTQHSQYLTPFARNPSQSAGLTVVASVWKSYAQETVLLKSPPHDVNEKLFGRHIDLNSLFQEIGGGWGVLRKHPPLCGGHSPCWRSNTTSWSSTGGRRSSTGGRRSSTIGRWSSTIGRRSSTISRRSSTIGRRSSTIGRRSSTIGRRSSSILVKMMYQ